MLRKQIFLLENEGQKQFCIPDTSVFLYGHFKCSPAMTHSEVKVEEPRAGHRKMKGKKERRWKGGRGELLNA